MYLFWGWATDVLDWKATWIAKANIFSNYITNRNWQVWRLQIIVDWEFHIDDLLLIRNLKNGVWMQLEFPVGTYVLSHANSFHDKILNETQQPFDKT